MQISHRDKPHQPSINFCKRLSQHQTKSKNMQIKKQIKINKRKLPLDFFKDTFKRSLSRRSPLEQYSKPLSTQRDIYLKKHPQTQRKISSHHNLPCQQIESLNQFSLSQADVLEFNMNSKGSINQRLFHPKQLNASSQTVGLSFNTTLQKLCPPKSVSIKSKELFNSFKIKQFTNKGNLKHFLSGQNQDKNNYLLRVMKINQTKQKQLKKQSQISQAIDMNCTFGKGFQKSDNFSLQNTIIYRDDLISDPVAKSKQQSRKDQDSFYLNSLNNHNTSLNKNLQIQEQIQRQKSPFQLNLGQKKYFDQRSTQQSQLMEAIKMQENPSFGKWIPRRKLFAYEQYQNTRQDKQIEIKHRKNSQKINTIKWNHSKTNVVDLLRQFQLKSCSKDVYTSQNKQRVSKNRQFINSSSKHRQNLGYDHAQKKRQRSTRKQKTFQCLNLPKIDKTLIVS